MLASDKLLACSVFFVSGLVLKPLVWDLALDRKTLLQQLAYACGINRFCRGLCCLFTKFNFPVTNRILLRESSFYQLGQSPKILRPKPHGLERTDSQTIGDFTTRRKGMYFSTVCIWSFIKISKTKIKKTVILE